MTSERAVQEMAKAEPADHVRVVQTIVDAAEVQRSTVVDLSMERASWELRKIARPQRVTVVQRIPGTNSGFDGSSRG